MEQADENSKRTRVEPVFGWLHQNEGSDWPQQLVGMADGLGAPIDTGRLIRLDYEQERRVGPSAERLAWMIRNAGRLAPREGRRWRDYRRRAIDNPRRDEALRQLDRGDVKGLDRLLRFEGKTSADCFIECERAVVWVEGKRNDWLDYSTTWDVTRDQLSRNTEAAWICASALGKDFCLIVCHEHPLKHHEEALIGGYRHGTWAGGWPHLTSKERQHLGRRIGTLTWKSLTSAWPPLTSIVR